MQAFTEYLKLGLILHGDVSALLLTFVLDIKISNPEQR